MYNNEGLESKKMINLQNKLFTINTNYHTAEINKVMKSSTNIFTHLSPLLTETLTSFTNQRSGYHLKTIMSHNDVNRYKLRNKMKLVKPKNHINF